MRKIDLKDDFGHKNGWGISFMNQFESKMSGNDGFWSEKERGRNNLIEKELSGLSKQRKKMI